MRLRRTWVTLLSASATAALTALAAPIPAWAATSTPPAAPNYQAEACPAGSTPSAGFSDTSQDPFAGQINCIAGYGITTGLPNGTYDPTGTVLRQQMAVFVDNLLADATIGAPPAAGTTCFPDIAQLSTTERTDICALAKAGVVHGDASGHFNPAAPVSRAQMAIFLVNALAYARLTITAPAGVSYFTDVAGADVPYINQVASVGITQGCGSQRYCPSNPLPRDEMAAFLARTLELAIERGVAASRYNGAGAYTVSPGTDASAPTGATVNYQVSGLPSGQPFELWLFACPNVSTAAGGAPVFTPTGSPSAGYTADQGSVSAVFSYVSGTQTNSSRVGGSAGSSGSFAFSVTDAAAECVTPVIFSNTDRDGVLNVTAAGAPTEPVGVGGSATFYVPPPTGPVATGSVTAASDTTFTQGGSTYPYSGTDTLQLSSSGTCTVTSLATFSADVTAGDTVTGSYAPSGSTYCLSDTAPLPPSTVDAAADPTVGGVQVTWNDSATPSVASYDVYRALATPPSGSTGYTCPAAGPAPGTSPQSPPPSPYALVGTATDGSPGAHGSESYSLVDTSATPGSSPANQYCYAVSAVDARGEVGTAQPATQNATGGTTAAAPPPGLTYSNSVTELSENVFQFGYNDPINTATCDGSDFVASYTTSASGTSNPDPVTSVSCANTTTSTPTGYVQLTLGSNVPGGATLSITDQVGSDGNTVCAAGGTTNCQPGSQVLKAGPTTTMAPAFSGASFDSATATITLRYNELVNPATVDAGDFTLSSGTVTGVSTASSPTTTVTVQTSGVPAGQTVTVTAATGTDGNTVCDPVAASNCQAVGDAVSVTS